MSYSPKGGSGYGGQSRRGSGIGKRFGRGQNRNVNQEYTLGGDGLNRGSLADYGWKAVLPEEQRHQALTASIKAEGFASTQLKLVTLRGMTGVPQIDNVIEADLAWLGNGEPKLE